MVRIIVVVPVRGCHQAIGTDCIRIGLVISGNADMAGRIAIQIIIYQRLFTEH